MTEEQLREWALDQAIKVMEGRTQNEMLLLAEILLASANMAISSGLMISGSGLPV